jgi:hypothetical protein
MTGLGAGRAVPAAKAERPSADFPHLAMKSKPAETSTVILARTQTDDQLAGEITDGVVSRMAVSRTSPRRWPAATRNNPDFIGNRVRLHFRRFRHARGGVAADDVPLRPPVR